MYPTYPYEPGVIPNDWRNMIVGTLGGSAPDNSIGVEGNYFLDLSNSTVWGPYASGAWPNYAVPLGNGANAIVGATNGVVPSNTIGADSDYFIDIGASVVFGPKTDGVWPTPSFPLGGTANTIFGYSAGGPPSFSIGVAGDYFWDISTSSWYGPKTLLGWPLAGTPVAGGVNVIFGPSNGQPANTIGIVGSYFVDTIRHNYYGPKTVSGWPASSGLLLPSQTASLANMIAGSSSGTPPSNAIGADGNYFYDTDTGDIYGPKATGAWPSTPVYSPSMSAADGNTITGQSVGAPSNALGNDGDYYINTTNLQLYGPKYAGAWPSSGLLLTESNTITGNSSGAAPNNAIGLNGDYFIDTTNGDIYGPKAAGAWPGTPTYVPASNTIPTGGVFAVGDIAGFDFRTGATTIYPGNIYTVNANNTAGTGTYEIVFATSSQSYARPSLVDVSFSVYVSSSWLNGVGVGTGWQLLMATALATDTGSVIMQRVS